MLRKRNHVLWHLELLSGRLPVKIVKTLNDRQSTLLAESLRSFLDKSGKGKEERGKKKEERGRRKEERGKGKAERGKRKEERGKRKEERGKKKEESGKRKGERGKRKEESGKSNLKKVLSVTKHGFVFWAQGKPNAKLEIYKVFQDRLTFLNRHKIVWIGCDF